MSTTAKPRTLIVCLPADTAGILTGTAALSCPQPTRGTLVMAYPPPYPPRETVAAHARQEWHSHIQDLLHRARSEADPQPTPGTPPWLLLAARTVTDFLHERITAAVDQAVTDHRDRLADAEATGDRLRRELDLLRDNVRNFVADTISCPVPPDRADANAALAGWGIVTLPARYTVTLTVTLDATVTADDEEDAEAQAQNLVHDLFDNRDDDTLELGTIRTGQVSEHDEPVDLGGRPPTAAPGQG